MQIAAIYFIICNREYESLGCGPFLGGQMTAALGNDKLAKYDITISDLQYLYGALEIYLFKY